MIIAKKKVSNVVIYGADITDLQKKLKTVEKDLKKASREIENSAKAWTKLTAPIAAFGVAAVASFQKVEAALNKIRIGTGATGKALQGLQADFRKVASSSTSSLDSVATAIADLNTKLGLAGEPLQELSTQVVNLSKMTGESVSALSDSVSKAFRIAQVDTEAYGSTLDRLFTTSQNTGVGVNALATSFTQFAPILNRFGLDINSGTLLLGNLEKAGFSSSNVMGALQKAMGALGKSGVVDVGTELNRLIGVMKNTSNETERMAIASKLFGGNAQMMLEVIRQGQLDVGNLTRSLFDNVNSINDAAQHTETLGDKWNKLTNSFSVNGSAIGQSLNNLASGILDKLTNSFKNVNSAGADTVTRLGLIAAGIGPLQFAFSSLTGVVAKVVGELKNVATAMKNAESFAGGLMAVLSGPTSIAAAFTVVASVIANQYIKQLQAAQAETARLKAETDKLRNALLTMTNAEVAAKQAELARTRAEKQSQIDSDERLLKQMENAGGGTDPASIAAMDNLKAKLEKSRNELTNLVEQEGLIDRHVVKNDTRKLFQDIADEYENGTIKIGEAKRRGEQIFSSMFAIYKPEDTEMRQAVQGYYDAFQSSLKLIENSKNTSTNRDRGASSGFIYGKDKAGGKSGSSSSIEKNHKSDLELQAEADKEAIRVIKEIYADQDWQYQHHFTTSDEYYEKLKGRIEAIADLPNKLVNNSENRGAIADMWKGAISDLQSYGDSEADQLVQSFEAGKISASELQDKAKALTDQFAAMNIPVGNTLKTLADGTYTAKKEMEELRQASIQALGQLKSGLIDAIVEGGNLSDTLSNVGKQLIKIALNSMIAKPFASLTKAVGGIFGVHTGGVIGIDPPSFVRSLPKFHTGGVVGANEQLAVLQTGEAVFTKEQQKALGGLIHKDTSVKDITINITNNGSGNMSNEQAQQLAKQIKAYVKTEVADEMYTYNRQKMYSMG